MTTLDDMLPHPRTVIVSASPLFECALAIAAFTRDDIYDKLEQSLGELRALRERIPADLQREVQQAGEVHTWRSLLLLAHRCAELQHLAWEHHVGFFTSWLNANVQRLRFLTAPYLGEENAIALERALTGDRDSQEILLSAHRENPVVHNNLAYLFSVDSHVLQHHLTQLLLGWVSLLDVPEMMHTLARDVHHTRTKSNSLAPSDLIRTITHGEIHQVPGMDTLWLIPQISYRPFTIVNYLPRCVVYYYPVADTFLPGSTSDALTRRTAALHKALGDATRLRLLRLLRHAPKSLDELTTILGATKSNVHHHLALLRSAGLASVQHGVYSMDPQAVASVGDELRTLLDV